MLVSIIIPAFNEAENIERTLNSIYSTKHDGFLFEVIVVDNGSTDDTRGLAVRSGATVYEFLSKPIGAVRNYGAHQSNGDIFVFLDADVMLTDCWHASIENTLVKVAANRNLITGSHCSAPSANISSIERYWFNSFEKARSAHLGTGHMIMHRDLFMSLQGFDISLETGEDYDFCSRAEREQGAMIEEESVLKVVHYGFPKNIVDFVKREAWHGTGDLLSVRTALASKVLIAATVFAFIHLMIIGAISLDRYLYAGLSLSLLLVYLLLLSLYKFGHQSFPVVLLNTGYFYFYLLGRCLSSFFLGVKIFSR